MGAGSCFNLEMALYACICFFSWHFFTVSAELCFKDTGYALYNSVQKWHSLPSCCCCFFVPSTCQGSRADNENVVLSSENDSGSDIGCSMLDSFIYRLRDILCACCDTEATVTVGLP